MLLSELRKRFFTLTLWHTWQATDAQRQARTNWNIFDSKPFSLPCSTSLKVYVPITYFSHLQCWFLRQRLCVEWLAQQGTCAHSVFLATTIKNIKFLKNWHQAFKISAFSIAVADASCFSRNHCSVFSLLYFCCSSNSERRFFADFSPYNTYEHPNIVFPFHFFKETSSSRSDPLIAGCRTPPFRQVLCKKFLLFCQHFSMPLWKQYQILCIAYWSSH